MKLDPFVTQIIVATNFEQFTTSDVRSAYLALKNDPSLDPNKVRRKIYSELMKLVKKGWLKKKASNIKGLTSFSKTEQFDVNNLSVKNDKNMSKTKILASYQQHLLTKLKHCKSELLLNIGESEAYKELYSEFPMLVDEIQPKYNKARDDNTKILGKIRAIEGLLKQDKQLEKI